MKLGYQVITMQDWKAASKNEHQLEDESTGMQVNAGNINPEPKYDGIMINQ